MKTELLSPAGNLESLKSAIHHGANAVYIGGVLYSARSQATNFDDQEIIEAIQYAHLYDVKVYVTVNTLIKESEFQEALDFIEMLYRNDVDAIIVQDIGLASVAIQKFPQLALHASTQMNIHSVNQAKFLKSIGFKRVILGRECSIETIEQIKEQVDIEVEVFVHGALCMCYSGNCYMSSIIGKRSGNRGKCAQPCRLLYSLENEKPSYLLSPKDLMTLDNLEQLLNLNIDSLKIEGRMKRPEYVALITEIYSKAIQSYYNKTSINKETMIKEMKEMFNREFTKGYMFHEDNQSFTNTKYSNHIGIKVGEILKTDRNYIIFKTLEPLENNDSIRIVGKVSDAVTISEMYVNGCLMKKVKANETVKIRCHKELLKGSFIFKTTTNSLMERLSNYEEKKLHINGKAYVLNNKLHLQIDYKGTIIDEESSIDVEKAVNNNTNRIIEQLKKTNNTPYIFDNIEYDASNIFLPISVINDLRRRALDSLTKQRLYYKPKVVNEYVIKPLKQQTNSNQLFVQVNNEEQYDAARSIFDGYIFTENTSIKKDDNKLLFINPRINNKNNYNGGIQNYDLIGNNHLFNTIYLPVFNSYSIAFFIEHGIQLIGMSLELSSKELKETINAFYNRYGFFPNTYLMAYGRYELMIMKHCLINKYLKCDKMNCQKCLQKQYYLTDRLGFKFPLIRTNDCHLKLLNSKVLNLINNVNEINENGINNILISFTIENKETVLQVIEAYLKKMYNKEVKLIISDVTYGHFNEGVF